jgi:hypothetical protein
MTSPLPVQPTYYPIKPKPPEPPKPMTAPPGYYIDNNGNLQEMSPIKLPPQDNSIKLPPGYTVDDYGNLKLMPGYYDNGSGIGQPIPPPLPPQIPPPEVSPQLPPQPAIYPSVGADTYPQPPRSNPQNLQTDDIRSFVNANIGDPATIASAMQQYGLNATDVAQAMGVDPSVVTSYLGYGTSPQPDTSVPKQYTETPPTPEYLTPPTPTYLTPPIPTYTYLTPPPPEMPVYPKPKVEESYPAAPTPNPDMSQLVTLPDGSQVYTGQ